MASAQERIVDEEEFFETKVRPLLSGQCVECHGPDLASGGLRLDSRDAILRGGESGPALIPGNAEESLLVRALRHDEQESLRMPPDGPLDHQAIEDLRHWISLGANWPAAVTGPLVSNRKHWAFSPLQRVPPPEDPTGWSVGPVDRFIADRRRQQGLQTVGQADKRTLLRRAYYDLIGLPPTPEQVRVFLADDRPGAFAELVEELLASPRYGERWGRHWLDLVRYADTAGDDSDYPIPQAYLYRDYVIDAFNNDVPYDRFLHEQLAGDILAREASGDEHDRLVIATGFIAQAKRIGTRELEGMHLIIEDTLATTSSVILGLSLRCARCHDHKYDPLSQTDYYALYGFFASIQYPFPGSEEVRRQTHFAPLLPHDQVARLQAEHDSKLAQLRSEIQQIEARSDPDSSLDDRKQSLADLEKKGPLEGIPTAYAVRELTPVDVRLQQDGNPRREGEIVRRGVPRVLDADGLEIPSDASGRLELARWMTEKASFLTARVMVNRVWQHHFGKPLVATPSDFGFRGATPTHPELLDWLATEFIDSGWSIKSLHRKIMLSSTYQLASTHDEALEERDSGNAWYWRFDRGRLDAEALRDTILALSGTLDSARPGPHPFPEPSKWRFTAHHQFNQIAYPSDHRSVYLMVQRLHAHPYLKLFDGPDASLSTAVRDNSTVPLQALYLLNNEMIHRAAERFAEDLLACYSHPTERLQGVFLRALARPPDDGEHARGMVFLQQYEEVLRREGVEPDRWELESWSGLVRTLLASNELIFVD
jgi:hypothetical protein